MYLLPGAQTGVSLAKSLDWQDCWQTVVVRAWSQIYGPFRIIRGADRSVSCLASVSAGQFTNCCWDMLEPSYRTTQNLRSDPVWWAYFQELCLRGTGAGSLATSRSTAKTEVYMPIPDPWRGTIPSECPRIWYWSQHQAKRGCV